ncbi:MAG: Zn-dependent exopeptidase M28 [Rubrobacteridae bacterium]|nr:Zn-dependent exopeptidase M28 [Rubrobacteridae bacterium]
MLISCKTASSTAKLSSSTTSSSTPKTVQATKQTTAVTQQTIDQKTIKENFDVEKALKPIKYLSVTIGKRFAGTANENKSATYLKDVMSSLGLATSLQTFKLPNKTLSYNVVSTLPATQNKTETIILGAHYDSKVGPGANDNASGVGALIELARIAKLQKERPYTLRFVFFGAEERVGNNPNNHHFGSRYFVKHMSEVDKKTTREMICVDMIASGSILTLRSLNKKPDELSTRFLAEAKELGIPSIYKQAGDDSDFEAFERAGIKSAWLEWRPGYYWHTAKDTYDRLNKKYIKLTGDLLQKHLF